MEDDLNVSDNVKLNTVCVYACMHTHIKSINVVKNSTQYYTEIVVYFNATALVLTSLTSRAISCTFIKTMNILENFINDKQKL